MEFQLYEDVKVATWRRYTYDVEAETLEEAVKLVKDGGRATHEIYSAKDDVLLYSNKDNV